MVDWEFCERIKLSYRLGCLEICLSSILASPFHRRRIRDGRISFVHDEADVNFDRSYFYDHVGTLGNRTYVGVAVVVEGDDPSQGVSDGSDLVPLPPSW